MSLSRRRFVAAAAVVAAGHSRCMTDEAIRMMAALVGIEHAGIGTDADLGGYDALPQEIYEQLKSGYKDSYSFREKIDIEGLDRPKKFYHITDALVRRGYSDDNIRAVLGENFRRALGEIWLA